MKYLAYVLIAMSGSLHCLSQEIKKIKVTDLEKTIRESQSPLIVNFWATFCKPCMEELPHFQKMAAEYRSQNVQFLLVSLDMKDDYPVKVKNFVARKQVKIPVAWLDETDADYFCPRIDAGWSGAIPATLFIHNRMRYRKFTEEPLTEAQLAQEIKTLIKP